VRSIFHRIVVFLEALLSRSVRQRVVVIQAGSDAGAGSLASRVQFRMQGSMRAVIRPAHTLRGSRGLAMGVMPACRSQGGRGRHCRANSLAGHGKVAYRAGGACGGSNETRARCGCVARNHSALAPGQGGPCRASATTGGHGTAVVRLGRSLRSLRLKRAPMRASPVPRARLSCASLNGIPQGRGAYRRERAQKCRSVT